MRAHPAPKLLTIGIITGFFGGFFGLGGGIIVVPALVFWLRFNQRTAAATSAVALLPTTLIGALTYGLFGAVDLFAAAALALGATAGSFLGGKLLHKLRIRTLEILFCGFTIYSIAALWLVTPTRTDTITHSPLTFALLCLLGLLPGLGVALLGIGGGIIAIPALISGFGASDLTAKGTSMLMVLAGAGSATAKQLRSRACNLRAAVIIGITAACAVPLGVQLAALADPLLNNLLFSAVLLLITIQYLKRIFKPQTKGA